MSIYAPEWDTRVYGHRSDLRVVVLRPHPRRIEERDTLGPQDIESGMERHGADAGGWRQQSAPRLRVLGQGSIWEGLLGRIRSGSRGYLCE